MSDLWSTPARKTAVALAPGDRVYNHNTNGPVWTVVHAMNELHRAWLTRGGESPRSSRIDIVVNTQDPTWAMWPPPPPPAPVHRFDVNETYAVMFDPDGDAPKGRNGRVMFKPNDKIQLKGAASITPGIWTVIATHGERVWAFRNTGRDEPNISARLVYSSMPMEKYELAPTEVFRVSCEYHAKRSCVYGNKSLFQGLGVVCVASNAHEAVLYRAHEVNPFYVVVPQSARQAFGKGQYEEDEERC